MSILDKIHDEKVRLADEYVREDGAGEFEMWLYHTALSLKDFADAMPDWLQRRPLLESLAFEFVESGGKITEDFEEWAYETLTRESEANVFEE